MIYASAKRLFDITFSLVGLVALLPFIAVISAVIKAEDGGPVFYRGTRTGRDSIEFQMLKFRTMVVDAEKLGGSSTADDDPRITSIGKTLRKYKLDELPQLINVLKGDMSFVGPRPEVKKYTDLFTGEEKVILSVRPGITDWASLWNPDEGSLLKGAMDPDRAYEELIRPTKLKLQMKYVKERSFFKDFKIIYLTVLAILKPESRTVAEMRKELSSIMV